MPLLAAWYWLMAALFGVSAALQYNDPDPLQWIGSVPRPPLPGVLWGLRRITWPLAAAVTVSATVWAGLLVPQILGHIDLSDLFLRMSEKGGRVEVGREIGGLVLVAAWMVVLQVFERRRRA